MWKSLLRTGRFLEGVSELNRKDVNQNGSGGYAKSNVHGIASLLK